MKVAVLGAGLQGACIALELAANGVNVDLYDRNSLPLTKTSVLNEGKIHLGFYYGNDPSLRTARAVLKGALNFAPLLRRWIGEDIDRVPVSPPYSYGVHKDSLLTPEAVECHLLACNSLIKESGAPEDAYFGAPYGDTPARLQDLGEIFNPETITTAFSTPEVAISAEALAVFVRTHLATEAGIRMVIGANVRCVTAGSRSSAVDFEASG